MAAVYCTKCGIRGDSKCPHHRSVFPDRMPWNQDFLDQLINVRTVTMKNDDGTPRLYSGGEKEGKPVQHFDVFFVSYKDTDKEAIKNVLEMLQHAFSEPINLDVAACVHDWQLMPGVHAEIGCCVGPANDNVPPDPFAEWKKENRK